MRKLCGAVSRVDYFPRVLEVTVSIGQFDKSFITFAAERFTIRAKTFSVLFLMPNQIHRFVETSRKNILFDLKKFFTIFTRVSIKGPSLQIDKVSEI